MFDYEKESMSVLEVSGAFDMGRKLEIYEKSVSKISELE